MKNKKFKLFASLTSLVMVVAVMAVGVWAATTASVGITSQISFSATNIAGTLTVKSLDTGVTATVGGEAYNADNNKTLISADVATTNATSNALVLTFDIAPNAETGKIESTSEKTITFAITPGADTANIKVTVDIQNPAETGLYMKATAEGVDTLQSLAQNSGEKTFTIKYALYGHTGASFTNADVSHPTVSVTLTAVNS